MEIINDNKDANNSSSQQSMGSQSARQSSCTNTKHYGTIYLGSALVLLGLMWLLHNFDLLPYKFYDVVFSWQMLLIILGGYFLSLRQWAIGGIIAAVGVIFMLTDMWYINIPVAKIVLPAIVIAFGISLFFTRKNR